MFVTPDVTCLLKSATLKLDEDGGRLAHVTCTLEPFTPELAHELGEDVAEHLFMPNPNRADPTDLPEVPRPEVSEIGFLLPIGAQRITAKDHAELTPVAVLKDVQIQRIRVTRPDPERPRLALAFVLVIHLDAREAIDFVVRQFGRYAALTFESMQRDLPLETDATLQERIHEIADDFAAAQPKDTTISFIHGGKTATITPQMAEQARVRKKLRAKKGRR